MTAPSQYQEAGFRNLWRVAGFDEHEHSGRTCHAIQYEREDVQDVVRVRFTEKRDLFDEEEALIFPHMLFPVLESA